MIALVLLLAAAPRVAVIVHPTGFSDDDAKRLQEKVGQEVAATGAELSALPSIEVTAECLADPSCARDLLRTVDASYLVWIEALRAGRQVQLEAHVLDAEGRSVAQQDAAARADEVVGAGNIVPAAVLAPLQAARPAAPAAVVAPATPLPLAAPRPPAKPSAPNPAVVADPDALSPLAIGGLASLGAGALLALGGGAVAVGEMSVIGDPASLSAQKDGAATVAVGMFVVVGLGIGVTAAGGVLLALGM